MSWRIWDADRHDEMGDGTVVNRQHALVAARQYAEDCCSDDPEEYAYFEGGVDLVATHTETGERVELTVTMEPSPMFYARPRRG